MFFGCCLQIDLPRASFAFLMKIKVTGKIKKNTLSFQMHKIFPSLDFKKRRGDEVEKGKKQI